MSKQVTRNTPVVTRSISQNTDKMSQNADTIASTLDGLPNDEPNPDISVSSTIYTDSNSLQQLDLQCKQKTPDPSNPGLTVGNTSKTNDNANLSHFTANSSYRPLLSKDHGTSSSVTNEDIDLSDIHPSNSESEVTSGENKHLGDLCNSFSELTTDFDNKLCSSFRELTQDLDMICNMFPVGQQKKVVNVKQSSADRPNYFRDNFNSTPLAEPRLKLAGASQVQVQVDKMKLDSLIKSNEECKATIKYLTDKLSSLEVRFDKGLMSCGDRVKTLEDRVSSEVTNLNEQTDGAFSYMDTRMDTRMDLMLADKYREIDAHFTETFSIIDTKISEQVKLIVTEMDLDSMPKLACALDSKITQLSDTTKGLTPSVFSDLDLDSMPKVAQSLDSRFSQQNKTLKGLISESVTAIDLRSMPKLESMLDSKISQQNEAAKKMMAVSIEEYLDTKELKLDNSSPLFACFNEIISKELENTRAETNKQTNKLTDDLSNIKQSLSKELGEIRSSINFLSDDGVQSVRGAVPTNDLKLLEKKIETLSMWVGQQDQSRPHSL